MIRVSVEDIQRDIGAYLQRVEAGETLVVLRAGNPIAEVVPVPEKLVELRPVGLCKGEFEVPDDFNAPLPDDVLDAFEGS